VIQPRGKLTLGCVESWVGSLFPHSGSIFKMTPRTVPKLNLYWRVGVISLLWQLIFARKDFGLTVPRAQNTPEMSLYCKSPQTCSDFFSFFLLYLSVIHLSAIKAHIRNSHEAHVTLTRSQRLRGTRATILHLRYWDLRFCTVGLQLLAYELRRAPTTTCKNEWWMRRSLKILIKPIPQRLSEILHVAAWNSASC